MLTKDEFIRHILGEAPRKPEKAANTQADTDLDAGHIEGFDFADDTPESEAAEDTRFVMPLLQAGFGDGQGIPRAAVIRSADAVARHIPDEVRYWPKTPTRPHHTLLIETDLTHRELLAIPAFKAYQLAHLDIVEDALARLVAETLDGFQRGAEGLGAAALKGPKHETLCVVSIIDEREGHAGRLACFGTVNAKTDGLETFFLTEHSRTWDRADARERLGLIYERQFKKLGEASWQEAFTTTDERKQAENLLEVCTRKNLSEQEVQESILDLLDTIARGFGLRKKSDAQRRLRAFDLPGEHDIGIDSEEREGKYGGTNPFSGVTLRDDQSRLLGYIIYPLKTRTDAEKLRQHLKQHNRFHNVLVVYPDANQASIELWQGREQLTGKLRKGQSYRDAADVVNLLSRFFVVSKAKVRNPVELAHELAYRARYLRRLALRQLEDEPAKGPLRNLYNSFKMALVHDQKEDDFADAFAQTITYGLLTARWFGNDHVVATGERFTRQNALKHLPVASPFLNDLFKSALSLEFDEQRGRLLWLVDDVTDLLDRIDVSFVFGAGDKGSDATTDPVIHFYEPFLGAYNSELKNKRGVFFTPRPVVSYIVRGAHEILQKEFGLENGLASTETWDDVANRVKGLQIPDGAKGGDPFVSILDPATGTGTFLYECIELIEHTMKQRWCTELGAESLSDGRVVERWRNYVPTHLLPRLYGYELMVAPYAVAHLKLAFKLERSGYQLRESDRLNIYLTNSLELPTNSADSKSAGLFETFAKEAQAVSEIKRSKRFTVVIGNPPYSKISSNLTLDMRAIVERYRFVGGERIRERGALQFEINLQDDYVKFMRLCETTILAANVGVLGLITNNGYLSTPTLRGMRDSLLETFSTLRLLDLHGHLAKGEIGPDGTPEENVFDIQLGVSLILGGRNPAGLGKARACVFHADCYGSREHKYEALRQGAFFSEPAGKAIVPTEPFYLLIPHDGDLEQEWRSYAGLNELFPRNSAGIITARDALVIAAEKRGLAIRMKGFSESQASESAIYEEYGFSESKRFNLREAQKVLRQLRSFSDPIIHILYRPFDERHLFFHQSVVWSMSRPMAEQMRSGVNLALVATRQVTRPQFEHAFVTRHMIEIKSCSHDRNTQIFPLFIVQTEEELGFANDASPNLAPTALSVLRESIGQTKQTNDSAKAETEFARQVFAYVYAVLHAPSYRKRYFEFLRSEFPRIPLRPSAGLLAELSSAGARLVALHLLDSPKVQKPPARYTGQAEPRIEKLSYDPKTKTVRLNKDATCGFGTVAEEMWSFRIGGYRVCEKWLKDRKGSTLSNQDVLHYERILSAIELTLLEMAEIDQIIDRHGGWPGAFTAKASES